MINELEFSFVALRRSGHHAVVEWLLSHLDGRGCFLNDCQVRISPFVRNARAKASPDIDLAKEVPGRLTPKDYLVHNYENKELDELFSPERLDEWDDLVGTSRRRVHILVLRDPFNNFASLVRWARGERYVPDEATVKACAIRWKAYAREYLGLTELMPPEKVVVSYNAWFTDRDVRERLAADLGLTFTDEGIDRVARWGPVQWGDSFDGLAYDGRAQEMGVLQRFVHFQDDPLYLDLFDAETLELSDRIFGQIAGTEPIAEHVRVAR